MSAFALLFELTIFAPKLRAACLPLSHQSHSYHPRPGLETHDHPGSHSR